MKSSHNMIVIPEQAGIQKQSYSAQQTKTLVPLCGDFFLNWIPACAGMTVCS